MTRLPLSATGLLATVALLIGACQTDGRAYHGLQGRAAYEAAVQDEALDRFGLTPDQIRIAMVDEPPRPDGSSIMFSRPTRVWMRVEPCDWQGYLVMEFMGNARVHPHSYTRGGCSL